jgi:elongation factor 1-gamma
MYTLYTYPGAGTAIASVVAAESANTEVEIVNIEFGKTNKTPEFLALNPIGKVPTLETPEGGIFESGAIARFFAGLRSDKGLLGQSNYEKALVDSWAQFGNNELYNNASPLLYPILIKSYAANFDQKKHDEFLPKFKRALQTLENHLLLRTYIVGEQITLADISCASAIFYPMKFIMDKSFRKDFSSVSRWFQTCVNQPEFAAVMGDVPLCEKAAVAGGAKKAEPKKAAKKAEAAPAPKPKKQEHPLAVLNKTKPSSMKMDAWKVQYSNTKPCIKAMDWFWENLDKEGYSIWFSDYKYNEDNTMLFMTCNAVGGFLQRSEEMRKYAFGVMDVVGEEGKELKITGCWLFRGDSEKPMMEANPEAEYYAWTKVTNYDDATKARVAAYWCNEEELEGLKIQDSKVFK